MNKRNELPMTPPPQSSWLYEQTSPHYFYIALLAFIAGLLLSINIYLWRVANSLAILAGR